MKRGAEKEKLKNERKQYYDLSVLSISHVASFKASTNDYFASNHSVTHSQQNMVTSLLLIKTIKINNQKRQLANEYESATNKQKVIMPK